MYPPPPPLPPATTGIRDPFGWREALTPTGVSPVGSARNSRAGSNASTPRNPTPPLSPHLAPGSGGSAHSSRSNMSGRSGGSGRYTPTPAEAFVCSGYPERGAFPDLSARTDRTSNFYTPEPSARSSDFVSVYDAGSVAGSARLAELSSLAENGLTYSPPVEQARQAGDRGKKKKVMAAALDAFAISPSSDRQSSSAPSPPSHAPSPPSHGLEEEQPEVSLDPRQIYSAARHGRHKEVEAALQAGFDPDYGDSFGNTLFHVACQNGNKRIAKLAIKYGGDMDAQNGKGHTGLHFLFSYGYPDIAEYFISKGADETIVNESGNAAREGIR